MPADIRPTPRSTLLHYPGAFDPEMEFQLREKDIATLHEMQNSAVNVEAHLLIRRARMKEEEMKSIDPDESLEVKLDVLVSAVEEMMQRINTRNDYNFHGSLIEEEQVADPKHFVSHPSCHSTHSDCFVDHLGEERTVDMTCMLDDMFYTDDLPQYDQYDDDYVLQTEANLADKSAARLWEEEVHFQQLEYNDQPSYISYDSDEESAEKFEVSEGSLPFCFDSCQFIRDNYHAIRNQMSTSHLESNENFVQDFSYSDLQPPKAIDCQVTAEDLEVDTHDLMIQGDFVPFCFESVQFLKGRLHSKSFNVEDETDNKMLEQPVASDLQPPNEIEGQITDEGIAAEIHDVMMQEDSIPFCFEAFQFIRQNFHIISQEKDEQLEGCHTFSMDTLQQSFQVFHDPIADVLDEFCSQNLSPLSTCELETCSDMNFIRQPVSSSFSVGVSSQGSDQSLHLWYEEKRSNPLDELSSSVHEFQDPYAVFLEADKEFISFNGSVSKLSWELPFSSSLLLFLSENLWRIQKADEILTWLHWLFHFT